MSGNLHVYAGYKILTTCIHCGKEFESPVYEYIGAKRYHSNNCGCVPRVVDIYEKFMLETIDRLGYELIDCDDWDVEKIDKIHDLSLNFKKSLKPVKNAYIRIRKPLKSSNHDNHYYNINNYYLILEKYKSKKSICEYIGGDLKAYYRENKDLSNEKLYIRDILNISDKDYCYYLSYMVYLRRHNK